MDALLIRHGVAADRFVQAVRQRLAGNADIHRDRLGAFEQAIEMGAQKGDLSAVDAQPFPDAVAEHEAAVEYRNSCLRSRRHHAVYIDQNFIVARIGCEIMRALSHGG